MCWDDKPQPWSSLPEACDHGLPARRTVTCGQKKTWHLLWDPGPFCYRGVGCPELKDVGVPRQAGSRGSAAEKDFRISLLPFPRRLAVVQHSFRPLSLTQTLHTAARASEDPHPLARASEDPHPFVLCLKSQGEFPNSKNKEQTPWHRRQDPQ